MRIRLVLCLLAAVLAGCVPRLYQRETLTLNHPEIDRFDIRYADFDGCLLRRPVPVAYKLERSSYTLTMDIRFGEDDRAPGIDLGLAGGESLSAKFPDLDSPPTEVLDGGTAHYRIDARSIRGGTFLVQVLANDRLTGEEAIRVERSHCRALSLGKERGP